MRNRIKFNGIENDIISNIISQINTQLKAKNKQTLDAKEIQDLRRRILSLLDDETYLHSRGSGLNGNNDNLLVHDNNLIQVFHGEKFDLNLELGEAIIHYYHDILVHFSLVLHQSDLKLKEQSISFYDSHHLFGLPEKSEIPLFPIVNATFILDIHPVVKAILGKMEIDRSSFPKPFFDIDELYSKIINNKMFQDVVDEVISVCSSIEDLEKDGLKLLMENVELLQPNSIQEKELIRRFFVSKIEEYTRENSSLSVKDFHKTIEDKAKMTLKRESDRLYLEDMNRDGFFSNFVYLFSFMKCSGIDESFYDELILAYDNHEKNKFREILFRFYEKYSMYFMVEHFTSSDLSSLSDKIRELLDSSDKVEFSKENGINLEGAMNAPRLGLALNFDIVDNLFQKMSVYTKSIFYEEYKLITEINDEVQKNNGGGSLSTEIIFDLIMQNGYINNLRRSSSIVYPNFIKIYYKLNLIHLFIHIISDHFSYVDVFPNLKYELFPLDVRHMDRVTTGYIDIKIEGSRIMLTVFDSDGSYQVKSIQYNSDFKGPRGAKPILNTIDGGIKK